MVKLTPQGFVVDARAPGTVLVRVHWTPYWAIQRGTGCVEQAPGGYTMLDIDDAGPVPGRDRLRPVAGDQLRAPLPPGADHPVRGGAVLRRPRGSDRPNEQTR